MRKESLFWKKRFGYQSLPRGGLMMNNIIMPGFLIIISRLSPTLYSEN
jgi:hypothetical protein